MKAYKGFDKDLRCLDFQYEVGKEYTEPTAKVCECGFHSCLNPADVFKYYPPTDKGGNLNRFCEVEIPNVYDSDGEDSKVATTKIKICKEIGIDGLVKAMRDYISENTENNKFYSTNTENFSTVTNTKNFSTVTNTGNFSTVTNTENFSTITNTGDFSTVTNTGDFSAVTNTENFSTVTNTGDFSTVTNTGDFSIVTNTGNFSTAVNTGNSSTAVNTGNSSTVINVGSGSTAAANTGKFSAAVNTGKYSTVTNTGDFSSTVVTGEESIAIAVGLNSKAKGAVGCWLVIAEKDDKGHILNIQAVKVDGKIIKADTFYTLIDGEIKESR